MAYKEIVVHVGPDERSAVRLDAAVELAERHEGKVTGVYVLSRLIVPGFASFELSTEVYKRLDTEQRALAEEAERQFAERMAKSTAPSEWRLTTGDPVDALTTSAHYADIAVVGQTDPDDANSLSGLADSVVLGAGGPVLVWPYAGSFSSNAETVVLAWNSTREAKRALSDALPIMQQASRVIVLGIDTGAGKHIARCRRQRSTWHGTGSAQRPGTRSARRTSAPATPCSRRSAISGLASSSWAATAFTACERFCPPP